MINDRTAAIPTADNYGCLPIGTDLPAGTIIGRSYTAYLVEDDHGRESYVPFAKVHPVRTVEPLISFQGAR